MHLSVLSSLALMLVLMSTLLHLVAMFTRGWVRVGIMLPATYTRPDATYLEHTQALDKVPASSSDWLAPEAHGGHAHFLLLRLWMWTWCQDLQQLSPPQCQTPGSLRVIQRLSLTGLGSLVTCIVLLQRMCQLTSDLPRRKTVLLVATTVICFFTLCLLVSAVTLFVVCVHRDVTQLVAAVDPDRPAPTPELGWPLGVEAVSALLITLSGVLLCVDLRNVHKQRVTYALVV